MDKLKKALTEAMEDEDVPSRVKDEANSLLSYCDSYMRQGHGAMRQPKTPQVVPTSETTTVGMGQSRRTKKN